MDRRELRYDKEREQAKQVTAWADWHHDPEAATFARPQHPAAFIANSSDAAAFDVFVDFRAPIVATGAKGVVPALG